MKKISTYQQFNNERKINLESNQVNEEILSWLKKKAKNWLDNIRDINSGTPSQEDKSKQIEELSKIIPTEILNTIKDEVKKLSKSNESLEILFEGMFDALTGELKADSDFIKMSDEEKDEYLRQISQDKYFKFYPEGEDWTDGNYEHSEFQEFLLDKGIDVNRDIQVSYKPSIKNIETKIDGLDMSDSSKKALKIASITVLLLLLSSKAFAGLGDHSSHGSDFGTKAGVYGKIGGDGDKKITQKDSEKKTDLGKISTTKSIFTTTEGSEKVNKLFNSSYLPKLMGAKTIEEAAYGLTAKEFVEKLKMAYDNEKMLNDPQDGVLKFFKDNGIKPGSKDVKQYQEDLSKIKGFEEFKTSFNKSEKFDDGSFGVATAKGAIKRWIDNFERLDPSQDISKMFKTTADIDKQTKMAGTQTIVKEKPIVAGKTMDIGVGEQNLKDK